MSKGGGDVDLGGQLTETQQHSDKCQRRAISQGHTIENLMPVENDAIAIAINEPQGGIDESASVYGRATSLSWRPSRS